MNVGLFGIISLGVMGCGAVRAAPQPSQSAPAATAMASAASSAVGAWPAARPAEVAAVPPPAPLPSAFAIESVQVLSVSVTAIALGDGTRVAALADQPYVGDARGLRPLALPAVLRPKAGEVDHAGIFFGRDNEPRIMGQRQTARGEAPIYWRHLPNGWRDGREEIGRLGGPARGGLWGVLGGADPELVCRTGVLCIIKRQSGWATVPAGSTQRIVTLQDGMLWGLDSSGISSIDKHGWQIAIPAPEWLEPHALWATRGEAWVGTRQQLFHYLDGEWHAVPSPVGEVSAFWGAHRGSVWLSGRAGAAHFDGRALQTVAVPGPLYAVRGRSDSEVWFSGEAGLFRVRALH